MGWHAECTSMPPSPSTLHFTRTANLRCCVVLRNASIVIAGFAACTF
jgi:hypothetical protein